MARNFDCPYIGGMVLRADVVMLENAGCVKIVHKRCRLVARAACLLRDSIVDERVAEILIRIKVPGHIVYLPDKPLRRRGKICVAALIEAEPE